MRVLRRARQGFQGNLCVPCLSRISQTIDLVLRDLGGGKTNNEMLRLVNTRG
jgi:hypothetical protein